MPKQKILELHVRDSEIQLRAANAALRESEQKYRSMVEIIPDWVWQVDRNGIYTYSSPKVKDLLGYEPEEIIGTSPFDLLPEAQAEHMRAVFHDIVVSRSPIERLENTNVHKDGRLVVLETSAVAIYDEHGEFAGYRGIDRDITIRKEAENALIESQQLLGALVENVPGALYSCALDRHWTMYYLSDMIEDITGYAASDFINNQERSYASIIHPDDRKMVEDVVREAVEKREVFKLEYRVIHKDGHIVWVFEHGCGYFDADGELVCLHGVNIDITEQKRMVEVLNESRQSLAEAQRITHIGNWDWNLANDKLTWSDEMFSIFGIDPEEFTGIYDDFIKIVHPMDRDFANKEIEAAAEGRKPLDAQFRLLLKDGTLKYIEAKGKRFTDENGRTSHMIGTNQDITERKQAEQQIETLSRFPGENPSPVLRVTIEGKLLYANDASSTILKEWGSVIGQGVPEKWCNYIREAFESEKLKRFEIQHQGKTLSFIITPVIEAGYANLYGRDITERRKSEIERERLMESLAEKSDEMERLLRIVTHDLRSPLVNIIGFSSELESDCQKIVEALNSIQMDEQLKENISEIANEYIPDSLSFITSSTKKMDSLITSLSQLSQLGRIELHIETINMDEMISEIVKATLYKVKQEGVSITSEHLPDCKGDDKQVNQVFANVIGNAIKYLDPVRKGQIKISGQIEGPMSIYCVEDNGVGIPDKHKDKVFEIFHR
ncbi:MAG TPA: PAS domain S-box protein, partial [Phycisphaerales bacterium]|nr:PAS domain S-box protein [Phycisphaerales bacterium]